MSHRSGQLSRFRNSGNMDTAVVCHLPRIRKATRRLFQCRVVGSEIGKIVFCETFENSFLGLIRAGVVELAFIAAEQRHLSLQESRGLAAQRWIALAFRTVA